MKFLGNTMHIRFEKCEENQASIFNQEKTSIIKKLKHVAHQQADNRIIFYEDAHHHVNRHL